MAWRHERPAQAPSNSSSSSPTSPGATASLAGAGSAAPSAPAFDRAGRPVQTADDLAGEIARLGAVTAELSAAEPLRALLLVERYLAENVSPDAAAKLEALRAEADRDLAEAALRMPPVRPVKYVLQETA